MTSRKLIDYQRACPGDDNYWELIIEQYLKVRNYMSQTDFCKSKDLDLKLFKKMLYKSPHYKSHMLHLSENHGSFISADIEEDKSAYDTLPTREEPYRLLIGNYELVVPSSLKWAKKSDQIFSKQRDN